MIHQRTEVHLIVQVTLSAQRSGRDAPWFLLFTSFCFTAVRSIASQQRLVKGVKRVMAWMQFAVASTILCRPFSTIS